MSGASDAAKVIEKIRGQFLMAPMDSSFSASTIAEFTNFEHWR